MAYSRVPFTYTGGPQVFPTNFALGVLEVDHIRVTVDGVVDGLGDPVEYAFTYNTANGDVTVTDALTPGQTGTINRVVPIDALIADFEAGADVSKRNFVRAVKHTLMAVQEAADGRQADSELINETVATINAIADGIEDNVAQTAADRAATEAAAALAVPAAATASSAATTATAQAALAIDAAQDVQGNIIPVGAIMYFAGTAVPAGWLAADGSQVSTVFPELRNYLIAAGNPFGTFGGNPLLPNLVNTGFDRGGNVPDAVLQDLKPSGTAAATFTANVWNVRELTTEDDPGGLITYTPGQPTFTPTVDVFLDAVLVSGSTSIDRLWNVTDGVAVASATTQAHSLSGNVGAMTRSLQAHLVAGKTYRFESRPTVTLTSVTASGLGPELYLTAKFYRKTPDVVRTPCVKAFGDISLVGMADLSALLTSIATQAEALAGTDNTKLMTPLRVAQAIVSQPRLVAAANFNGTPLAGTYSRTGNVVTVTMTAHGLITGQFALFVVTTGSASTNFTAAVTVIDANTFTYVDSASGTTSGNITRRLVLRNFRNVNRIIATGTGIYRLEFFTALPSANYYAFVTAGLGGDNRVAGQIAPLADAMQTTQLTVEVVNHGTNARVDATWINVAVFG
jgi:hypothetical protein